jgi:hypothetical protein
LRSTSVASGELTDSRQSTIDCRRPANDPGNGAGYGQRGAHGERGRDG